MIEKKINIPKGSHLSEVLPDGMMPSDVIIDKKVCGVGLTHSEIIAPRHSIIITPYTSQCESKANKHSKSHNLLAVVKGVTSDDVEEYMIASIRSQKLMKLITVPEDLFKIIRACKMQRINIYTTFFIFIDECQHNVASADWRKAMLTPLNLFFSAAQKAMASATPLGMSDPRFKHFTKIDVVPDYDYAIATELWTTNNILPSVRLAIEKAANKTHFFIFCKSARVIMGLIKSLGIEKSATVFCSEETADKIKKDYKHKSVFSTFKPEKTKTFNFLTFRFADGIDLELETTTPTVMVITDVLSSNISWINPAVDAYQIHGRFRNGVGQFFVITNYDSDFRVVSREQSAMMLELHKDYWQKTKQLMEVETNSDLRAAYSQILASLPFCEMVDEESGEPSPFLCDNYIENQTVKSLYNNKYLIQNAYQENAKYNITDVVDHWWPIGDHEYLKLASPKITEKEKRMLVVKYLDSLQPIDSKMKQQAVDELKSMDADTVEAYEVLGKERMAQLNYSKKAMKENVILSRYDNECSSSKFFDLLNTSFAVNNWYSKKYVKEELKRIHEVLGITPPRAITSVTITNYFYTTERRMTVNQKQEHGYILHERK